MESVAVLPKNFDVKLYSYFDKIFTFHDDLIDDIKIFKNNYSFDLRPNEYLDYDSKTGFICLISGNKYSNYVNELYSERYYLINYFEKHQEFQFSLYGTNWENAYKDKYYKFIKFLHKYRFTYYTFKLLDITLSITKLDKFLKMNHSNFKGPLSPKIPKLREYKFNICYENTSDINGYITEKIFDCFLAGCVPIYLGAPNIKDYIPSNTFIDRRDFKDNHELIKYLNGISPEIYLNFQNKILSFLKSDKAIQFSSKYTANNIVKETLNLL
jgi:hypothetical protein